MQKMPGRNSNKIQNFCCESCEEVYHGFCIHNFTQEMINLPYFCPKYQWIFSEDKLYKCPKSIIMKL